MFVILRALGKFVADMFKSRIRLEAENLFLRHQLNMLFCCIIEDKATGSAFDFRRRRCVIATALETAKKSIGHRARKTNLRADFVGCSF
jgi:hypothetical protein